MKVSELTGAELDYWVARAEGEHEYVHLTDHNTREVRPMHVGYKWIQSYSTDWQTAGPIIEREHIDTLFWEATGTWRAAKGDGGFRFDSPSLLTAAMRAYVASKFGEEVPDATNPA